MLISATPGNLCDCRKLNLLANENGQRTMTQPGWKKRILSTGSSYPLTRQPHLSYSIHPTHGTHLPSGWSMCPLSA